MRAGHNLVWWTRDEPARLFDLRSPGDLSDLWSHYGGTHQPLLRELVGYAHEELGARSVLAEYRYLDADYRSEHSRFYSTTFRRYPSVAHRLHFFSSLPPDTALNTDHPTAFGDLGYIGYSVMRPVAAGPVGRTMLPPSGKIARYVSCVATDDANVFGSHVKVPEASPFMNQESQLGVCVHVTAWVCAHYHHLAFGHPRTLPVDISESAPFESARLIPARNMSVHQLAAILDGVGLPPVVYDLNRLPPDETLGTIACRYLNSGFPVIVCGGTHAFVLVGYERAQTPAGTHVRFIRQDDQRGPYDIVDDPRYDLYRPWDYLVIPLPAKVYVSAEVAESVGGNQLVSALEQQRDAAADQLLSRIRAGTVAFRTTGMPSNEFKTRIAQLQRLPDAVVGEYQWTQMPRWIWITEAVDLERWDQGEDCVEAEAIIDATDHTGDPRPLAWRIPNNLYIWDPDRDRDGFVATETIGAMPSLSKIYSKISGNAQT